MEYPKFRKMFEGFLTGKQIADMQETAFGCYEDAHGYRPMRKNQKQIAYGFIQDLFYDMSLDDCIDYLELFDVSEEIATRFWENLENFYAA